MAWNDGFSDDPGGDHPHYVGGDSAAAGPRPAALPAVRRPMAVLGMAGRGGPASYPCKYFPAPGPCAALAAGGPGGPFHARGGATPGVPCSGRPLRSAGAGDHPGGANRPSPGGGRRPPAARSLALSDVLPWLWLSGAAVPALWHGIGYLRFRDHVRRWGRPVTDPAAVDMLEALRAELGIAAPGELVECPGVAGPMMTGLLAPHHPPAGGRSGRGGAVVHPAP